MIEKYTLKNNIPLYVVESHSSPVVSIQAWFTTGSIHETPQEAGISHFLEHALFKGTRKRKVGEVAKEIERHGGEINAFTSFEQTVYYTTITSRNFDLGFDVIADMVQFPTLDQEEMEREKEVILEEIRRSEDSPYKTIAKNLWGSCFKGSPYGRPVIGFVDTVKKINSKKLKNYFAKNYHTGSLALFIVGDIDKKEVFSKAQTLFKNTKKGALKKPITLNQKFKNQPSFIAVEKDIQELFLLAGFRMPGVKHPLIPAMDLLCTSLGQGESSRLYQRLVKDKKLVQDANFGLTATSGCGIASLDLTCEPEKIEAALAESKKVIEEIAKYGLEDHEIERVKNSLESEVVYGKEVFESYARRLGYYYCQFQDPSYEQEYLEALLRVDKEQIQKAMKMLVVETPQFSVIHPKGVSVSSEKILKVWEKPIVSFQYTEDPLKATPQKINLTQAPFIFKKAEHLPVLSAKFIFKGGSREETAENLGISNFFQKIWTSGTKKYNSFQIAHKLEALGASIHGFSGKNTLGLSVECLVKHWPIVKELFSEILLSPSFDEKEIEVEKELTLREVLTERDSPAALCQINFLETLYPNHSNGRSQLGTKESVQNFSREKLLKFYKDKITLDRLTISTVGALGLEEWKESLQEWEPNLKSGSTKVLPYQEINTPKAIQIITAKKEPLFQSQVMVGFLGNSIFDSERYALKLLSSCLSGQGGRLFLELRDKQSLAYSVSPIQSEGPEKGFFGVYIGCATEKLVKALQGIRIELEKILQTPLSNKELDRAKEYWLGRHDLDMQRFSSQAMVYGLDEVYGLGCDQSLKVADIIKGVTAKEIQAAAEKIIKLNSPVISIVHSSELVKEEVQQIWG